MGRSTRLAGAVALSWLAVVSVARGDNRAVAREAYETARRHYELNDFAAALEGFKRAYLAVDDVGLLFNIAQCHRQLGNKAEAIKFYRWFAHKTETSPRREEAERLIAALEAQLAREPPPSSPSSPPPSAPPEKPVELARPEVTPPLAVTTRPAPAPPVSPSLVTTRPAPRRTPVYKKWWLWTGLGVVVAGGAVAAALALTPNNAPAPSGAFRVHFQ
jgi:hypothetical protein